MVFEKIRDLFPTGQGTVPNKFTIGMGELIKQARLDANLTQAELAKQIYVRQATLSRFESGMLELKVQDLLMLSYHLEKPITYFFPYPYLGYTEEDEDGKKLTDQLQILASRLSRDDLRKVLAQVKAILTLDKTL